jgi:hypothetical protein
VDEKKKKSRVHVCGTRRDTLVQISMSSTPSEETRKSKKYVKSEQLRKTKAVVEKIGDSRCKTTPQES